MSTLSQFTGGTITNHTQSTTYTSSQTVTVPAGTKRIEALLCGGGSVGGFGGLQIYNIPVTGAALNLIIGAGTNTAIGGETSVSSNNTKYAAVGGYFAASGAVGQPPFNVSTLLWSALDNAPRTGRQAGELNAFYDGVATNYIVRTPGMQALTYNSIPGGTDATLGYGGSVPATMMGAAVLQGSSGATGGSLMVSNGTFYAYSVSGNGGAGGGGGQGGSNARYWNNVTYLSGGGGPGGNGGSLTSVSVWGLTGYAGGTGGTGVSYTGAPMDTAYAAGGGGGGGGMLGAGSNGGNGVNVTYGSGGNGGNGGGGGGIGAPNGTGGNGFAIFRFYY